LQRKTRSHQKVFLKKELEVVEEKLLKQMEALQISKIKRLFAFDGWNLDFFSPIPTVQPRNAQIKRWLKT
jgi:hypothetical protein